MGIELKLILLFICVIAFGGIVWGIEHHGVNKGRAEIQAKWDIDKAKQIKADNDALIQRNKENAEIAAKYEKQLALLKQEKEHAIEKLSGDYVRARAVGLRYTVPICAPAVPSAPATAGIEPAGTRELPRELEDFLFREAERADKIVEACRK